jgi:hypothetical protein
MKRYTFTIQIAGVGENEQEAWLDATEAFDQDPGMPPKGQEVIEESGDMVDQLLKTGVWTNPNSPLFKGEK